MNTDFKIHFIQVIERVKTPAGKSGKRGPYYRCLCTRCGNTEYIATSGDLRSGRIKSCGCLRNSEEHAAVNVTHGQRRQNKGETTRTYKAWSEMKRRCDDKWRVNYKWYGGKGISYDKSWKSFEKFYEDMGDCPATFELDRIDASKNYTKENCRWLSHHDNMQNVYGRLDK